MSGNGDWTDDPADPEHGTPDQAVESADSDANPSGTDDPHESHGGYDDLGQHSDTAEPEDFPDAIDGVADPDFESPVADHADPRFDHDEPAELAGFGADAAAADDGGLLDGRSAARAVDQWAQLLGYGATDPEGAHAGTFDHLDLAGAEPDDHTDPGWLTGDLAAQRATWVAPTLLDGSDPDGPAIFEPTSGEAAVLGLWERLGRGAPLPRDTAGAADLSGALDMLASLGGAPLRQVVDAARRLLDG